MPSDSPFFPPTLVSDLPPASPCSQAEVSPLGPRDPTSSTHPRLGMGGGSRTQRSQGRMFGLGIGLLAADPWGVMGCWREGPARPSEPLSPPPGAVASGGGLPVPHSQGGPGRGQRDAPWRECQRVERETGAGPGVGLWVSGCPLGHTGGLLGGPSSCLHISPTLWVSPPSLTSLTHPPQLSAFLSDVPCSPQAPGGHGLDQCPWPQGPCSAHRWLQGERVLLARGARCEYPPPRMALPLHPACAHLTSS